MTDGQQIALAITPTVLPTLTVLVGILVNNRQIDSLHKRMDLLEAHIGQRFEMMEKLFTEKLKRVEEVMDAHIRHLEERQ